jgi:hypothetical protein
MSAGCYLCELSFGFIPDKTPGDAVGACKLCGVLACLAHGYRNKSKPAYICGVCLPNLLAVAAVKRLPTGDQLPHNGPPGGAPLFDPNVPPDFGAWASNINNVEDVIADFSSDRWHSIRQDVDYLVGFLARPRSTPLQSFTRAGSDQARALMATAIAVATLIRLPAHEMIPMLREATLVAESRNA